MDTLQYTGYLSTSIDLCQYPPNWLFLFLGLTAHVRKP